MKHYSMILITGLLLGACAPLPEKSTADLSHVNTIVEASASAYPDLGPAPELSNEVWLNVDGSLRLADLRGKVVLLEMWTFGCYNCRNVIPSLRDWHHQYANDGLVIIGNHYPEFRREKDLENLKEAIVDLDIPYAVAQDNDGATWRAYDNRFWPALYLIDKNGHIRYTHVGEGAYDKTEAAIVTLLNEPVE
jgi:thiol-disulfide isomerase/thioredoxin